MQYKTHQITKRQFTCLVNVKSHIRRWKKLLFLQTDWLEQWYSSVSFKSARHVLNDSSSVNMAMTQFVNITQCCYGKKITVQCEKGSGHYYLEHVKSKLQPWHTYPKKGQHLEIYIHCVSFGQRQCIDSKKQIGPQNHVHFVLTVESSFHWCRKPESPKTYRPILEEC